MGGGGGDPPPPSLLLPPSPLLALVTFDVADSCSGHSMVTIKHCGLLLLVTALIIGGVGGFGGSVRWEVRSPQLIKAYRATEEIEFWRT